jgi:MFS family permease
MNLSIFPQLRPSFSPARLAVTVVFFINGFVFSNWVPRIPAVQQQLGLSPGMLGLALWGIAIGALLSQSLAGWLVTRLSSRTVIRIASLLYCMALPLPALAVNLPTLMLALFALGLTNGLLDVAMNAHGCITTFSASMVWFKSCVAHSYNKGKVDWAGRRLFVVSSSSAFTRVQTPDKSGGGNHAAPFRSGSRVREYISIREQASAKLLLSPVRNCL